MASKVEQRVIDTALLVLLGWTGDVVDGGTAMRGALLELRAAFDALDASKQYPRKPCRWCGTPVRLRKDGLLAVSWCALAPLGKKLCECEVDAEGALK